MARIGQADETAQALEINLDAVVNHILRAGEASGIDRAIELKMAKVALREAIRLGSATLSY